MSFLVPTRCRQQFWQFSGLQFGLASVFGRSPVGRFASYAHPASLVSNGLRLDGCLVDDALGRPAAMASMGRDARIRLSVGHHCLYHRPLVCSGPSQRGMSTFFFLYFFPFKTWFAITCWFYASFVIYPRA